MSSSQPRRLLPQIRRRHWGRWFAAIVIIALLFVLAVAVSHGQIFFKEIPGYLFSPAVLEGLLNTVILGCLAQAVAIVVGVWIALMRMAKNPVASVFAAAYIWIFRGVPVLLQILLWYNLALIFPRIQFGLPFMGHLLLDVSTNTVMTAFFAAFLGLMLNESAYMAEIIRAGLNSVDKGQIEAAQSIGETPLQRMWRIVLPQAMRVIIPPTGNDLIGMIKGTSVASVIGYAELIRAASNISSFNLQIMETLIAAAIWYMVIITIASIGQSYIERFFDRTDRTTSSKTIKKRLQRDLLTASLERNKR